MHWSEAEVKCVLSAGMKGVPITNPLTECADLQVTAACPQEWASEPESQLFRNNHGTKLKY